MKRSVILVLLSLLIFTPEVAAAPKKIVVNPLQLLITVGNPEVVSGVVVSGKNIIVYGTENSVAYLQALDSAGKELWKLALTGQTPSIATVAAVDSIGDIWVAGSTSADVDETTPVTSVLNPDNTVVPSVTYIPDLQVITFWKVSALGSLVLTSKHPTNLGVLPTGISLDKNGLSVVGVLGSHKINAGFLLNADLNGVFSQLLQIGVKSTTAESVVRHQDGSFTVVGSSSENIMSKKLVGLTDGILVKVSKELKLVQVVRSSITRGERVWSSASTSLLLTGEVRAPGKSEIAVTKFSSSFVPAWTHRFPGSGRVIAIGSTQSLFLSTAAISQLLWNPKSPRPLLIRFDAKGAISAADSGPTGQNEVINAINSRELGFLVITSSPETVSIFTRVSR